MEQGKCTHWYMLEPISLFAIQTIASMRLSLHALRCETERWGTSDGEWLTMHTLPWTSLRVWVSHYDRNFSHNDNVHAWLQHSLVKFLNIKSRYSLSHISHERYHFWSRRSYLTSENDNKIYLSPTPRPFVLGVRYEPHPRGIYSKFLWLDSWSSLWAHPIDITFGFFQTWFMKSVTSLPQYALLSYSSAQSPLSCFLAVSRPHPAFPIMLEWPCMLQNGFFASP